MDKRIAIGCDEAAFAMEEAIKGLFEELGYEVIDKGVYNEMPVLYPDVAVAVCCEITNGNAMRGILMCGTGIGMAMMANKVPGIRAAVCHDLFSTERSHKSNDVQVICMGARVIGIELAKLLVINWLNFDFASGGSSAKLERIKAYELEFRNREEA